MESRISQAIIMRRKDFGEADLLVTFLTPETGCLKGVARSARRSRKRFPNCLDLFCLSRLEYSVRPRGDLYTLLSCRLLDGFDEIRRDFNSLSLASYMVEVAEMLSPPESAEPLLFSLLLRAFKLLEGVADQRHVRIFFEASAMALGGYALNLERCGSCGRMYRGEGRASFQPERGGIVCLRCGVESALCPGLDPPDVRALRLLQAGDWDAFGCTDISSETLEASRRVMRRHMDFRLGRRPKSLAVLGE